MKPIDKAIFGMVSESSGRNESATHRWPRKPKTPGAEPAPKGRRQHGPPQLTEAVGHSGGDIVDRSTEKDVLVSLVGLGG